MEQLDIGELLVMILEYGNTPEGIEHLTVRLTNERYVAAQKCARIVERQAIHSIGDAFAKTAPIYTIADMNSILGEIAAEIRLAGWK